MAAACGPAADSGEAEEPPADAPTSPPEATDAPPPEPTKEPEAQPTEEPAAEPTDEPAAEPTDEPTDTTIEGTMARTATCLLEPKEMASGIGVFEEGTTVSILGRGIGAGWVAVATPKDPEIGCWLLETDLAYAGEFTDLPIYGRSERSSDEPVVLPDGFESKVLVDVVCLFGPGSGYTTVAALLAGETMIVWGKGVGSGWFVVALIENGKNCWLPEDTVDFTGDINELTIQNAPPKQ
jgi:hypothetical protein